MRGQKLGKIGFVYQGSQFCLQFGCNLATYPLYLPEDEEIYNIKRNKWYKNMAEFHLKNNEQFLVFSFFSLSILPPQRSRISYLKKNATTLYHWRMKRSWSKVSLEED